MNAAEPSIPEAAALQPTDDLLLPIGRSMLKDDRRPSECRAEWLRARLIVHTRDDRWSLLEDAACTELLERAHVLAEDEIDQATAEASEAAQVLPQPRESGPRPRALALPLVWLDDAALPPHHPQLIPGLLGEHELGLVYGATSCGKTFFTIDMAGSIAAKVAWRDRETSGGLVAYIAAEAGRSIVRRFIAWRDDKLGDARESRVPLVIVPRVINLMSDIDAEEAIRELRLLEERAGEKLKMVIFDTLSRSMPGGDENKPGDMTTVIGSLDRMRDELSTAALLVHHCGKDATKGARGHSSLAAAVDVMISIEDRVATFEKVRDGQDGLKFPFELRVVEVGRDGEDQPITTCVCVATDEPPMPVPKAKLRLGNNEELALKVLRGLFAAVRRNLKERGDDPSKACITISGWRAELDKRDIARARYAEISSSLVKKQLIAFNGPHVELLEGAQ